jgi:hypothetical protein
MGLFSGLRSPRPRMVGGFVGTAPETGEFQGPSR